MNSSSKPEPAPWIKQVLTDMEAEEDALGQMPVKFTRETGMIQPVLDPGPDPDEKPAEKKP